MFKKKIKLIPIMSFLTLISFTTTVHAAFTNLYCSTVKQAKPNWCWAASAENAILWEANPTKSQWAAVRYIKGTSTVPYPNVPGTLSDSVKAAEYISDWKEDYTSKSYAASFTFLFNEVYSYSNKVLLSAGYYNSSGTRTGGHMVTLYGVNNSNNEIRYNDVWDDTTHITTYSKFCNGSYNGRKYDGTVNNTEY